MTGRTSPTSIPAAPPTDQAKALTRLPVRPKPTGPTLTAYQLTERTSMHLRGHAVQGFPTDWVICRGSEVIDLLRPDQVWNQYDAVDKGGMTITELDRSTLAQQLGFGSTESSQSLTRAVLKLATLSIGDIPVKFTTLQWEELTRRARKRGLKIGVYMQRMVDKMLQDLWTSLE